VQECDAKSFEKVSSLNFHFALLLQVAVDYYTTRNSHVSQQAVEVSPYTCSDKSD
jgi:hypothetical protein